MSQTQSHRMKGKHKYCTNTDECVVCPKYDDPRYAHIVSAWILPKEIIPCIYLGKNTGNKVLCPSCSGHVEFAIFECAEYGGCTIGKKVGDIACCTGCKDYTPNPTGITLREYLKSAR